MSFVDGRVIEQRMAAKDARLARELKRRMAKTLYGNVGEGGILSPRKQKGQHDADPDARPLETASPQAIEVPMTASDPTASQPACTANKVRRSTISEATR
jgi:hypothetical protein